MDVNTQQTRPTQYTSSEHWSIPANHAPSVYAFAELQVLTEHLERVRDARAAFGASPAVEDAVDELVASAVRRAEELTRKIRASATPKVLALFEDLDVARALPDHITFLPRVVWLLGALAALASIRAAAAEADLRAAMGGDRTEVLAEALQRSIEDARARWDVHADELLRRHPWVRGERVQIELVDIQTVRPWFRIPILGT